MCILNGTRHEHKPVLKAQCKQEKTRIKSKRLPNNGNHSSDTHKKSPGKTHDSMIKSCYYSHRQEIKT